MIEYTFMHIINGMDNNTLIRVYPVMRDIALGMHPAYFGKFNRLCAAMDYRSAYDMISTMVTYNDLDRIREAL